jgi:hypothetical protein
VNRLHPAPPPLRDALPPAPLRAVYARVRRREEAHDEAAPTRPAPQESRT